MQRPTRQSMKTSPHFCVQLLHSGGHGGEVFQHALHPARKRTWNMSKSTKVMKQMNEIQLPRFIFSVKKGTV